MPTVTRRARLLDLACLLCILAGGGLGYLASLKLQEISKLSYRHPGPRTESALTAADHARYLAYGGVALVLAGCVIGAGGAIHGARRKTA
ncbi:MAG: hypothetical protein M3Z05_15120 [Gemmatimonadota bacterium]|nr:hypothetical protein [Gemmatimonadota bacterium]